MSNLTYPATRRVHQVDNYHGVPVADPYRWLETATAERSAWIAAQNTLTAEYISRSSVRRALRGRFEELLCYSRYYELFHQGSYLFFKKNSGLQNQLVLYVQRGLNGTPEVLIDPNVLAPDGTVRLTSVALSKDGKFLAYALSDRGMEWEECFVKETHTRRDLPDRIQWVKASMLAWHGDGFYYSRFPGPSTAIQGTCLADENHQVWYHRAGTAQSADTLVYEDREHPRRLHLVQTTADERFVILMISDRGAGHAGLAMSIRDTATGQDSFTPVITSSEDKFLLVDSEGDRLVVLTDRRAPNWRLILIDPRHPGEHHWKEVIAETNQPIVLVRAIGKKLFVAYRSDAAHRLYVFDRSGRCEHEILLPGVGAVNVFQGRREDTEAFWSFSSFTRPQTIYRYVIEPRRSSVFHQPELRFDASHYETRQIFYASKDGTRIPMFIVHRKGLMLDGRHPALLTGYGAGGFPMGPSFDPFLVALLERGVVYAVACLRGGGEYGEAWHHAGWREKKQNVFDDCIAAAEWLQENGYTCADGLGLIGGSNGGLLVGAVMVQRPDLFKVALPCAGPMDMLRFQHFNLAGGATAEYGSSDDPAMFPILLGYSPLHNVREGVEYPATLVTTYEDDDVVVPGHSFKFIARLQELGAGTSPYLIRTESKSGHGPVSLPKAIAERADIYAFLLAHLQEREGFNVSAIPRASEAGQLS
jgi:prolyl oligopeptidase